MKEFTDKRYITRLGFDLKCIVLLLHFSCDNREYLYRIIAA
jgi:hypothetical protein